MFAPLLSAKTETKPTNDEITPSEENTDKPAHSSKDALEGGDPSRHRSKDPQISAIQCGVSAAWSISAQGQGAPDQKKKKEAVSCSIPPVYI